MTIDDLVAQVQAPITDVVGGLYRLPFLIPRVDPTFVFNRGLVANELREAQRIAGHDLHPLHVFMLALANGGSLPMVNSLCFLAAGLSKEQEWQLLVSQATPAGLPAEQAGAYGPFRPLQLGQSLEASFSPRVRQTLDLGNFIVIASGFDGEFYGYTRTHASRIEVVSPDFGRGEVAPDFEAFMRQQVLFPQCENSPEFLTFLRRAMAGER